MNLLSCMQGTRVSPRNTPRNGIALKYLLAKAYMLTSRFKNSLLTSSSPYLLLPNFEILANLMISHSLLLAHKDDNFFPMCLLVVKIIFHGNFHFKSFFCFSFDLCFSSLFVWVLYILWMIFLWSLRRLKTYFHNLWSLFSLVLLCIQTLKIFI